MNPHQQFVTSSKQERKNPSRKLLDVFISPHASVADPAEQRRARLSIILSLILTMTNATSLFFIAQQGVDTTFTIQASVTLITMLAYILSRRPRFILGSVLLVISLSSSGFANILAGSDDPTNAIFSTIPVALTIGSALLPVWGTVTHYLLTTTVTILLPLVYPRFTFDNVGTTLSVTFTIGILLIVVQVFRNSVEKGRVQEVQTINQELRELGAALEQRVAERTKALATSTEVSRRLSTILDQQQLVSEVVDQVQSAFGYYHAHIYLVDEPSGDLRMAGGTGEAGAAMLARNHYVPKGKGLVGRTAEANAPVLVTDVSQDPAWLPNPLLPETRAEVAVPIAIGDQVLGVLDIQQNSTNGLSQSDVDLLQAIANQVAIGLRNSQSFTEAKQRAEREALIAFIGQKIQTTTSVENALETAARELGRALGVEETRVLLDGHELSIGKS